MMNALREALTSQYGYKYITDNFGCSIYINEIGSVVAIDNDDWYVSFTYIPEHSTKMLELCGKQPKNLEVVYLNKTLIIFPTEKAYDQEVFDRIISVLGFQILDVRDEWMTVDYKGYMCLINLDKSQERVTFVTSLYDSRLVRVLLQLQNIYHMTVGTEREVFGIDLEGNNFEVVH